MEGEAEAGAAEAVGCFAPVTFTGLELVARFVWSIFLILASTMGAVAYTYKFEFEIQSINQIIFYLQERPITKIVPLDRDKHGHD